ncbi:hypothetical protein Trydic_g15732 [Trypoxylus dichotomus]
MELIKQRYMRIGWAECGIKECFKCLEHDHKSRDTRAKTAETKADALTARWSDTELTKFQRPYFKEIVGKVRGQRTEPRNAGIRKDTTRQEAEYPTN